MATTDELLDNLIESCKKHENPAGNGGFLNQLFRTTLHQDTYVGRPGDPELTKADTSSLRR